MSQLDYLLLNRGLEMTKTFYLLSIITLLLLSGCNISDNSDSGLFSSGQTTDASARVADVNLNGIKVSFRSSDIEFWASEGDFTNLLSLKYSDGQDHDQNLDPDMESQMNVSLEIGLSDSTDNVVFMPNNIHFDDFIVFPDFKEKIYDIVRIDIGSGAMTFSKDNSNIYIDNNSIARLDCNSIVLIDRDRLNEIEYVPRGGSPDNLFLTNLYDSNSNNIVDVDGALFIPFDPIDLRDIGEIQSFKFKIEWDMDDIFTKLENGIYTLNNNADGTPFDFSFSIEVR
ncbi:hypothetical protein [Spirochaeta isovalerica]|uniref:Uncharacterized protein n=1 Tax=Spirochaeta isovalerica TaxID=150 RepID=A0A841RC16_9SPIO|nr:hypothetical protein [Spirochaeta isovalerica]MBB6481483.1 hypothetical protein [Spirochaeta isovalerica]